MKVGIVGGSGYTGGELLRILVIHPEVEISWVTSRKYAGKLVSDIHPNLRDFIDLRFAEMNLEKFKDVDVAFLCLPHMVSMKIVNQVFKKTKIIDLSADFRVKDASIYEKYYTKHECPELIKKAVYGLPEIHREEIRNALLVANPGCNATAVILGLYPLQSLLKKSRIIVDVKEGSSASGRTPKLSNVHAERSNTVRVYKPKNHRHLAEIGQELGVEKISMSAHAVGMSRGILASCHIFVEDLPTEKDLWKLYRKSYSGEPFIRIVKKKNPPYNLPDIKGVVYSNFCEVGFVVDEDSKRIVVFSALDNLIKGASGQAVQNMNIMFGLKETLGLRIPGFYL